MTGTSGEEFEMNAARLGSPANHLSSEMNWSWGCFRVINFLPETDSPSPVWLFTQGVL